MLGVPVKGASTPRGVVGALPGAGQREKVAAAFGKEPNNSEFRKNYKPRRKTAEDAELRHRFAEADQNGDGSIDAIELTDALKAIGKYESEQHRAQGGWDREEAENIRMESLPTLTPPPSYQSVSGESNEPNSGPGESVPQVEQL